MFLCIWISNVINCVVVVFPATASIWKIFNITGGAIHNLYILRFGTVRCFASNITSYCCLLAASVFAAADSFTFRYFIHFVFFCCQYPLLKQHTHSQKMQLWYYEQMRWLQRENRGCCVPLRFTRVLLNITKLWIGTIKRHLLCILYVCQASYIYERTAHRRSFASIHQASYYICLNYYII